MACSEAQDPKLSSNREKQMASTWNPESGSAACRPCANAASLANNSLAETALLSGSALRTQHNDLSACSITLQVVLVKKMGR